MFGHFLISLSVVHVGLACSPPVGGYKPPTIEQDVHYAPIVALGQVTQLLKPDPNPGFREPGIYGAIVDVLCGYKGMITANITISGAGAIPGMCTSKDLTDKAKYILFLEKRGDFYEQTAPARSMDQELTKLLKVCGLSLNYRKSSSAQCPATTNAKDCSKYQANGTGGDGGGAGAIERINFVYLLLASFILGLAFF